MLQIFSRPFIVQQEPLPSKPSERWFGFPVLFDVMLDVFAQASNVGESVIDFMAWPWILCRPALQIAPGTFDFGESLPHLRSAKNSAVKISAAESAHCQTHAGRNHTTNEYKYYSMCKVYMHMCIYN